MGATLHNPCGLALKLILVVLCVTRKPDTGRRHEFGCGALIQGVYFVHFQSLSVVKQVAAAQYTSIHATTCHTSFIDGYISLVPRPGKVKFYVNDPSRFRVKFMYQHCLWLFSCLIFRTFTGDYRL